MTNFGPKCNCADCKRMHKAETTAVLTFGYAIPEEVITRMDKCGLPVVVSFMGLRAVDNDTVTKEVSVLIGLN